MTKKPIKFFALALLAMLLCTSVFACESTGSGNGGNTDSVIKSLEAKESSYILKIGESLLLTNCYTLEGNSALSAAQKACTYTSSDEKVAVISGKKVEAVETGEATITVTSKVDNTKYCEFTIKVGRVFIDHATTFIPAEDDFSNEWDDVNDKAGWFRTSSKLSQNYYNVKGVNSDTWYVETTITVHEVGILADTGEQDKYPKVGIAARDPENQANMITFFLDASIEEDNYWDNCGFCEVNTSVWSWDEKSTEADARHNTTCFPIGKSVTYNQAVTLGVARVGEWFHVFVNGAYKGSVKLSAARGILMNTNTGAPLASTVSFWGFNLDVTFSNYYATTDLTEMQAKGYVPANPSDVYPE